jgi:putative ABC transport system ATP-binding protein
LLTKWFGEGETKVTAVNGVGLVAHFGEMLFIVGPSGSGKTTLLSMISGILRPNSGTVTVKGADIWTLSNDQLGRLPPEHDRLRLPGLPSVSAADLGRERRDSADPEGARLGRIDRRGEKYLEIVGLKGRGEILPVKLSGGEQQRVAIARAIVSGPEILISTNRRPRWTVTPGG